MQVVDEATAVLSALGALARVTLEERLEGSSCTSRNKDNVENVEELVHLPHVPSHDLVRSQPDIEPHRKGSHQ